MSVLACRTTALDPSPIDLAGEFRARPFGVPSPERRMRRDRSRSLPVEGTRVPSTATPEDEWMPGRVHRDPHTWRSFATPWARAPRRGAPP